MGSLTPSQLMVVATFIAGLISLISLSFWYVLSRAKQAEVQAHQGRQYTREILDSIPSQIAVIDQHGMIIDVNQAWRQFSIDNSSMPGKPSPNTGVGTSYLDVCGGRSVAESEDVWQVSTSIRAVLEGRLSTFSVEYPCHSPLEKRWFMMTVTPLSSGTNGAVVTHYNITDRKMMELKIQHLAFFDGLTLLANRRLFNDRLEQALVSSKRSGKHVALVMIDLDNFKALNDKHGHSAGDLLLIEVARRLKSLLREQDTVARLGGDEFVLLIENLDAELNQASSQIMVLAQKVQSALEQDYRLAMKIGEREKSTIDHYCSSSIGVTLFVGNQDPDDLLFRADKAMYQAKALGKNRIEFA